MANEMTTKNALCTDDLDDLVLNGDDLDKQLTIPLNGCGGHHNHNNSSSPSSSVTATSTGANFIRSNNIYSAGPLLSTTNNNNVNGMMINNKHVTWRPETPPSPNIYTVSFFRFFKNFFEKFSARFFPINFKFINR